MTRRTTTPGTEPTNAFTPPGADAAPAGATPDGTARFRDRHAISGDFFKSLPSGASISSIGAGTYLGADTSEVDDAYIDALRLALRSGVNLVDTAINYRCQRSERAVGRAIQHELGNGSITRDEIVVCTKAGYIPLDEYPPATPEGYQGYLKREFFARRIMTPADVVAGGHCLTPGFIADCIARSIHNLGVSRIDAFYLHNPEQQLGAMTFDELRPRVRAAFELLEAQVSAGTIGCYGVATWQGLRVGPHARAHLPLASLVEIARDVAGDAHRFHVVQMPLNLAMPEAVRDRTQRVHGRELTALEAAAELGLAAVTSAPLMQGQLAAGLPDSLREMFPDLETDAQRAIAFARSAPGVSATLAGMKRSAHVTENLGAAR